MKNKLFVIAVAIVYILGMLAMPVYAEENLPTTPSVPTVPEYDYMVMNNRLEIGETSRVTVSVWSSNGVNANMMPTVVSNSALVVSSLYITPGLGNGMFDISFDVYAPATAEGNHNLSMSIYMTDWMGNNIGTQEISIPVVVVNNTDPDGLEFATFTTSVDTVTPGDEFSLTLVMKNNTGINLQNVKVSLPGLDSSKFVINDDFTYQTVSIDDGGQAVVTLHLIACDGITSVRETVTAVAEYKIAGQSHTSDCNIILSCKPSESALDSMSLTITGYKSSSDRIRPGRTFTLSVTVQNNSEVDIDRARINVGNLDGRVFAVNSGLTYRDFTIEAGEKKTFEFVLVGCEGISSEREVLPVTISYGNYSDTVNCTLSCKPEGNQQSEGQVFAPNIIITDYDFGGEFVVAGQKFPLTVTFQNVSADAVIENLKIIIDGGSSSSGGIAFSASNSANSFFFEKLDTKATDSVTMEMLAKSDATPNSYPIDISFSYEYTVGGRRYQASTINETLNVPLQQEDRLVVNEPSYPGWVVYVGDSCYISTSLVNMGKSGVYNVTASIQGEGFTMNEPSYYIGNIESGREEYYDTEIFPNMAGTINAELVITYEDSNGNAKEKRMPITIQTQEMMIYGPIIDEPIIGEDVGIVEDGYYDEFGNWVPYEQEGSFPDWAWYAIGGGGVLVVIIVIVCIAKAKKKKKMALEAEDEDEDI